MKSSSAYVVAFALFAFNSRTGADQAGRKHAENVLHARPAVGIKVGQHAGDIIGTDNRALQAAVDYVASLGGGIVEIGPGEYLMRDSLHLRSRVTVRGHGEKTILRKDKEDRSLLAADADFGEAAITVRETAGFEIGRGVYVASSTRKYFLGVAATIVNGSSNYFTLSRAMNADIMVSEDGFAATVFPVVSGYNIEDARVENFTVDGNRTQNPTIVDGCRAAGIFLYRGDNSVISNCVVRNYSGDGISFQQSNDVTVEECIVERCAGYGLHPGSGSQRPTVRNCRAVANGDDGLYFCWRVRGGLAEGNWLENNAGRGMSIGHKDSDNLVRSNTIVGNARGGVYWRAEAEPMAAHRVTFEGNTVRDNEAFGLFIDGATLGTVIRDNILQDTGGGRQKTAIRIGKAVGDVVLERNRLVAVTQLHDERPRTTKRVPTLSNVPYGAHERQVLDFYRASSAEPTPLLFFIHGGGWVRGDKASVPDLEKFLAAGISVVSINYRFTWQAQLAGVSPPVQWPLHDAARALQFVRSQASQWNIDKRRVAASGGSAGACSSLYLALRDDMADPSSHDPIARESTRLWCAAVTGAQTSLDPRQLKEWTPNSRYGGHAFGFMDPADLESRDSRFAEFLDKRESVLQWIKAFSPYEHVSKDDPPLYLSYTSAPAVGQEQKDPTHTANYGVKFQERCAAEGVECELVYPNAPDVKHKTTTDFLITQLTRK